jgi:hypothetical protein
VCYHMTNVGCTFHSDRSVLLPAFREHLYHSRGMLPPRIWGVPRTRSACTKAGEIGWRAREAKEVEQVWQNTHTT